jgi:hypothetical protein
MLNAVSSRTPIVDMIDWNFVHINILVELKIKHHLMVITVNYVKSKAIPVTGCGGP